MSDIKEKKKGPAIGIDLGTTYCCVGVWRNNKVEIIPNSLESRTTPSYVGYIEDERLFGEVAVNQAAKNPENTIYCVKRLMGREFKDPLLQSDIRTFPFKVEDQAGKPMIEVKWKNQTQRLSPEEVSAGLLSHMREIASDYLKTDVKNAVITVPAYFNDAQRQATKNAGIIAGLNVLRIINEPTAAAIAYGLGQHSKAKRVLVYDLGGGTFDVSIVRIDGESYEVQATSGDSHLGGEDFDQLLFQHVAAEFRKQTKQDITQSKQATHRLKRACEVAKRILSERTEANISIDNLLPDINFQLTITRKQFEDLCENLFKKTITPIEEALKGAKITKDKINEVVLVGGSTRIPKVQKMIESYFEQKIPICRSINPDEAIAYGAAVQAATLMGNGVDDLLLIDCTPLSLGISIIGDRMSVVVPRASFLPSEKISPFTTTVDNQKSVLFQVYEGESQVASENHLLGKFVLENIEDAKKGVPNFDVTFSISVEGMLTVKAVDKKTGSEKSIKPEYDKSRLTKDQIEKLIISSMKQQKKEKAKKLVDPPKKPLVPELD